jgi:hypothetical protein
MVVTVPLDGERVPGEFLIDRLVGDRRRVAGLGLDPELPELALTTRDQHLGQVRDRWTGRQHNHAA